MKTILIILTILISYSTLFSQEQEPSSLNKQGVDKGRDQKYESARQRFLEAAEIYDTESAMVLHNKALVLEKRGSIDEAMATYREAISRNPKQAQSYERLGYWHYKRGNYAKAVELGERSLEVDPSRPSAKRWIYDAYKKKVDSIEGDSDEREYGEDSEGGRKRNRGRIKSHFRKLDPYSATFFGTFDFLIRTKYAPTADEKFGYERSNGPITNFPYALQAYYRPYKKVGFYGIVENPYTGAALPKVSGQSERFEARYYFGKLILGGGLMLHHYEGDEIYGKEEKLTDFKLGSSIYYEDDESILEAVLYPRLLLLDWSWSTGRTLDTAYLEYKYTYKYRPRFRYHVRFSQADFYFFDHSQEQSNYWGYFDLAIGCSFENYSLIKKADLAFTIELARRYNLEKTDETKPYQFFNGQGLLGFDAGRSGGSLFSGQDTESTIINFRAEERFTSYFFIYQGLIMEFVGFGEEQHEFGLLLGAGYVL